MSALFDILRTFYFSSPWLLLIAVPYLAALVYQSLGRKKQYAFSVSDIDLLPRGSRAGFMKNLRTILLVFGIFVFTVALADPRIITTQDITQTNRKELFKHFIVLLDVSYSMSVSVGYDKEEGLTPYQLARESFREIVRSQKNERISLILFSNDSFIVTYPSRDMVFLENVLFQDDISAKNDLSQLYSFSGGTNTPKAFLAGEKILQEAEYANDKVFLLITDLFDNPKELINSIKRLRAKGVRIYVLGIATNQEVAKDIQRVFVEDDDVRVFSATSPADTKEAFSLIENTEYQRDLNTPNRAYDTSLRFYAAASFFFALLLLIFLSENIFFMVANRYNSERRA
ncbi:MAG: VWA domain-containing protein [Candidatus Spechtbacteria bacterium]|nr:VWA domain-containing protein [Candidatus Spechtbacteria bacterium]